MTRDQMSLFEFTRGYLVTVEGMSGSSCFTRLCDAQAEASGLCNEGIAATIKTVDITEAYQGLKESA